MGLFSDGATMRSPQVLTRRNDADEEAESCNTESDNLVSSTITAILPQRIVAGLSTNASSAQRSFFDEEAEDEREGDILLEQVQRNRDGLGNDQAGPGTSWQVLQAVKSFDAAHALRRLSSVKEDIEYRRDSHSPALNASSSSYSPEIGVNQAPASTPGSLSPSAKLVTEGMGTSTLHPGALILLKVLRSLVSGVGTVFRALFTLILKLIGASSTPPPEGKSTLTRALGLKEQLILMLDRAWSMINTPAGLSFIVLLLLFMMYLKNSTI